METISYHRLIPATITAAIILLFASVKAVGCVSARHSKTHGKTVMEHARILIVKIQTYLLMQVYVYLLQVAIMCFQGKALRSILQSAQSTLY